MVDDFVLIEVEEFAMRIIYTGPQFMCIWRGCRLMERGKDMGHVHVINNTDWAMNNLKAIYRLQRAARK